MREGRKLDDGSLHKADYLRVEIFNEENAVFRTLASRLSKFHD